MSRTDKTRPYWIRALDPFESRREYHGCGGRFGIWINCDFHLPRPRNRREERERFCGYVLHGHSKYWAGSSVPKSFIDSKYNNPMRREARDVLREAAKEWNAIGDTDLEPSRGGPRNAAWWYYW